LPSFRDIITAVMILLVMTGLAAALLLAVAHSVDAQQEQGEEEDAATNVINTMTEIGKFPDIAITRHNTTEILVFMGPADDAIQPLEDFVDQAIEGLGYQVYLYQVIGDKLLIVLTQITNCSFSYSAVVAP
jgi:hypothetical protein